MTSTTTKIDSGTSSGGGGRSPGTEIDGSKEEVSKKAVTLQRTKKKKEKKKKILRGKLDERWRKKFLLLKKYYYLEYIERGDSDVTEGKDYDGLYAWIWRQRTLYRLGKLDLNRKKLLDSINFNFIPPYTMKSIFKRKAPRAAAAPASTLPTLPTTNVDGDQNLVRFDRSYLPPRKPTADEEAMSSFTSISATTTSTATARVNRNFPSSYDQELDDEDSCNGNDDGLEYTATPASATQATTAAAAVATIATFLQSYHVNARPRNDDNNSENDEIGDPDSASRWNATTITNTNTAATTNRIIPEADSQSNCAERHQRKTWDESFEDYKPFGMNGIRICKHISMSTDIVTFQVGRQ